MKRKDYCDYCLREFKNLYRHKGETYCYYCKMKIFKKIGNIDLKKIDLLNKNVNVSLTEGQFNKLNQLCRQEKFNKSGLIRQLIDDKLRKDGFI